jgi:hypothetical protein
VLTKLRFKHVLAVFVLSLLLGKIGAFSNHVVLRANHGTMPVWVTNPAMELSMMGDDEHSAMTRESKYIPLSDIFPVFDANGNGIEIEGMASLGDLGILLSMSGYFLTVFLFSLLPVSWAFRKLTHAN